MNTFQKEFLSWFLSESTFSVFKEILFLALAIFLYSFTMFKFYKGGLAKRDLTLSVKTKNPFLFVFLIFFKFFVLLPFFTFLWFCIFSVLLSLISDLPAKEICILSVAIISSVRISAYFNEELSVEIAKTLPIILLATMLSKPNLLISFNAYERIKETLFQLTGVWSFLFIVVVLEFLLRIFYLFSSFFRKSHPF